MNGLPPGLRGYLLAEQQDQARQQAGLQALQGALGIQGALMKQQMAPLEMEMLKAKIAALPKEAALRDAQTQGALAKLEQEATQRQAQMGLAGLLSGGNPAMWGGKSPDMVAPNDQAAIEAVRQANAQGRPIDVGVPNSANVQALGVLANPQRAIPELLRQQRPQTTNESPIARVMRERDALPPGDPRRAMMDKYIEKLSTHSPSVQVNMPGSSDTVQGPDGRFYKFRIGKDGKTEAVPIQTATGDPLRPPVSASERRAETEERDAEITVDSVRNRIKDMTATVQGNVGIVGPAGVARRVYETGAGVVAPGMNTPALNYQNDLRFLIADTRKLIEKDTNLSNYERQQLLESLGGGVFQTPGSALRALNNVLEHVERKKLTGPNRDARLGVKKISNDDEFNALPSGTEFIAPDGSRRRKP